MAKKIDAIYIMNKRHEIMTFESVILSDESKPAMGHNDPNTQIISVNTSQHEDGVADTILHEILHVIDYNCQIGLEEKQVHALASTILQFFWDKRNGHLVSLLVKPR